MTIDFGTSCTGKDGRVRSGKILVSATSFKTFPSVRQKTFENFMVDGRKIEGTVIKTIQKNATNQIRTALVKENIVVTKIIAETTPLIFEASCRHIVSGIASFENSNGRKWSIDYGDGTCDDTATLTVNGKSKEITIH